MLNQTTTPKQPRKHFDEKECAVKLGADLDVQVDWEDCVDGEVEVV
jgi:hypothetical protein